MQRRDHGERETEQCQTHDHDEIGPPESGALQQEGEHKRNRGQHRRPTAALRHLAGQAVRAARDQRGAIACTPP